MYNKILSKEELNELRKQNNIDLKSIELITSVRKNNLKKGIQPKNNKESILDLYSDLYTKGLIVKYPHGNVMCYGNISNYYRGQIEDYGSCRSSLFRKIQNETNEGKELLQFIAEMRINTFREMINNLEQVKSWPFGDIFYYAIAQHYGFDTNIIDITGNLEVALFFACCKHIGNNKYEPIANGDIEKLGRYAVLYKRIKLMDLEDMYNEEDLFIKPIGYQPFTRCYKQMGYFIDTDDNFELENSSKFEKYLFERTPELSREIFEKFNSGKYLFQYDALSELEDLINNIKSTEIFTSDILEMTYNGLSREKSIDWYKNNLDKYNIEIGKSSYEIPRHIIRRINRKWSLESFVKSESVLPATREVLYQ